jgi:FKBP-type peptidyl-prolyl cis-trans isomerase FkpA
MSVTAVPIPPTPSATKVKLFGGIALALVLGGGLAWYGTGSAARNGACGPDAFLDSGNGVSDPETFPSGLRFQTVKAGSGSKPTDNDITLIKYKGSLTNGTVFDERPQAPMPVKGVIPGFSEALKAMQPGGSYRICIPPALGYGEQGGGGGQIPANATLRFEIDLMQFMPLKEFEEGMKAMQEQQAKQGGAGGPGGPGGIPGHSGEMPGGPEGAPPAH